MISGRLVKAIEKEGHKLAADLVASVRQDRRAAAYENLSDAQFEGVVLDLYANLGQWLHSRTWHRLQTVYEKKGRERQHGSIPLDQVIFSLTRTKTMLLDFIRGSLEGDGSERDLELELILSVSEFFDRAIYHTIYGYEDARRSAAQAAEDRAEQPGKPPKIEMTPAAREESKSTPGYDDLSRGGTVGEVSG
jgi:hypothetical protein